MTDLASDKQSKYDIDFQQFLPQILFIPVKIKKLSNEVHLAFCSLSALMLFLLQKYQTEYGQELNDKREKIFMSAKFFYAALRKRCCMEY